MLKKVVNILNLFLNHIDKKADKNIKTLAANDIKQISYNLRN